MKKIDELRKQEFLELYNQGYNDYDISRKMKLSDSTIFRWRKEKNLPPHRFKVSFKNKKIIPTQEQLEILTGTLLGDSGLQYYPKYNWQSPIFKCDHGEAQQEYASIIATKLSSLGGKLKKYNRIDKRNNRKYISYTVTTKSNPYFLQMYNQLYSTGKKEICREFLKNFTIQSLAYLYMDDGYADQNTAYICTDSYSYESMNNIIEHIKNSFDLKFTIVNHGKYFRLRLSQYDFPKFKELVEPYIIESLKYKLKSVS